jgi:TPR repeat protein
LIPCLRSEGRGILASRGEGFLMPFAPWHVWCIWDRGAEVLVFLEKGWDLSPRCGPAPGGAGAGKAEEAEVLYREGISSLLDGSPEGRRSALRGLRRAAELGHAGASCELGAAHSHGLVVPVDEAAAFEWYRRAADLGAVGAMHVASSRLRKGIGVGVDRGAAVKWCRKAAGHGRTVAMSNLGRILMNGDGA